MVIETLENRRQFSVSVTEMYPGFYDVQGDQAADNIAISVSMGEESFTLDNTTYSCVSYIFVHGAGGEDNISVTSVDGTGSIGASITGDDGNDSIKLNFDGGVWGGDGNDVIYLTDSFQGVAHGGAGNDQMYIVGACYNAMIIGDTGNDFIDCSQNYYSVVVHAGLGNDTVYGSAYDDQLYGDGGNDEMYGLEGNDSFYTSDNTNGLVDGGNGYDILYTGASVPSAANIEQQYML